MANPNIFQQYLKPVRSMQDYSNDMDAAEQNRLALATARMQGQQGQQAMADDQAMRRATMESGGDQNKLVQALLQGGQYKNAQSVQKAIADAAKSTADLEHTKAQTGEIGSKTKASDYKLTMEKRDTAIRDIAGFQTAEEAAANLQAHIQSGDIDATKGNAILQSIPQNPADFPKWQLKMLMGIMSPKEQVGQLSPDANARLSAETSITTNANTNNTSRLNNQATVGATMAGQRSTAATAQAAREQSALQHGEKIGLVREKLASPNARPMSPALQKELIESDDAAQSSKAVINTLNEALKINKDAYSGYAAKGRAVLASNLPGSTPGADATIDLDNMMTGQALESLKAVFGGMPTEGERKILLEMQASADKTPAQREAIIKRAIATAERRGAYAEEKAKSIRSGGYLTDGVPESGGRPSLNDIFN